MPPRRARSRGLESKPATPQPAPDLVACVAQVLKECCGENINIGFAEADCQAEFAITVKTLIDCLYASSKGTFDATAGNLVVRRGGLGDRGNKGNEAIRALLLCGNTLSGTHHRNVVRPIDSFSYVDFFRLKNALGSFDNRVFDRVRVSLRNWGEGTTRKLGPCNSHSMQIISVMTRHINKWSTYSTPTQQQRRHGCERRTCRRFQRGLKPISAAELRPMHIHRGRVLIGTALNSAQVFVPYFEPIMVELRQVESGNDRNEEATATSSDKPLRRFPHIRLVIYNYGTSRAFTPLTGPMGEDLLQGLLDSPPDESEDDFGEEDEDGGTEVSVETAASGDLHTEVSAAMLIPFGTRFTIREPFCTLTFDGELVVLVKDPRDMRMCMPDLCCAYNDDLTTCSPPLSKVRDALKQGLVEMRHCRYECARLLFRNSFNSPQTWALYCLLLKRSRAARRGGHCIQALADAAAVIFARPYDAEAWAEYSMALVALTKETPLESWGSARSNGLAGDRNSNKGSRTVSASTAGRSSDSGGRRAGGGTDGNGSGDASSEGSGDNIRLCRRDRLFLDAALQAARATARGGEEEAQDRQSEAARAITLVLAMNALSDSHNVALAGRESLPKGVSPGPILNENISRGSLDRFVFGIVEYASLTTDGDTIGCGDSAGVTGGPALDDAFSAGILALSTGLLCPVAEVISCAGEACMVTDRGLEALSCALTSLQLLRKFWLCRGEVAEVGRPTVEADAWKRRWTALTETTGRRLLEAMVAVGEADAIQFAMSLVGLTEPGEGEPCSPFFKPSLTSFSSFSLSTENGSSMVSEEAQHELAHQRCRQEPTSKVGGPNVHQRYAGTPRDTTTDSDDCAAQAPYLSMNQCDYHGPRKNRVGYPSPSVIARKALSATADIAALVLRGISLAELMRAAEDNVNLKKRESSDSSSRIKVLPSGAMFHGLHLRVKPARPTTTEGSDGDEDDDDDDGNGRGVFTTHPVEAGTVLMFIKLGKESRTYADTGMRNNQDGSWQTMLKLRNKAVECARDDVALTWRLMQLSTVPAVSGSYDAIARHYVEYPLVLPPSKPEVPKDKRESTEAPLPSLMELLETIPAFLLPGLPPSLEHQWPYLPASVRESAAECGFGRIASLVAEHATAPSFERPRLEVRGESYREFLGPALLVRHSGTGERANCALAFPAPRPPDCSFDCSFDFSSDSCEKNMKLPQSIMALSEKDMRRVRDISYEGDTHHLDDGTGELIRVPHLSELVAYETGSRYTSTFCAVFATRRIEAGSEVLRCHYGSHTQQQRSQLKKRANEAAKAAAAAPQESSSPPGGRIRNNLSATEGCQGPVPELPKKKKKKRH
eukprot:GHVU01122104.1.p1 GENE.GHVU01122104.1~~GHVU01122104.1.p1  ORF type:complete len:1345 (+),score=152.96 GHVU01122104.1:227-4261(+)